MLNKGQMGQEDFLKKQQWLQWFPGSSHWSPAAGSIGGSQISAESLSENCPW